MLRIAVLICGTLGLVGLVLRCVLAAKGIIGYPEVTITSAVMLGAAGIVETVDNASRAICDRITAATHTTPDPKRKSRPAAKDSDAAAFKSWTENGG